MSPCVSFWARMVFSHATTFTPDGQRLVDPVADDGIGLQHPDARSVGDELDVDVRRAEVRLDVLRIVEREVPFRGIGLAHLQHYFRPDRGLRRLRGRRHRDGEGQDRDDAGQDAAITNGWHRRLLRQQEFPAVRHGAIIR